MPPNGEIVRFQHSLLMVLQLLSILSLEIKDSVFMEIILVNHLRLGIQRKTNQRGNMIGMI